MSDTLRAVRLRVGRNVRHLRQLRGWSQEQLAERAGNSHKHIGRVERGEVNVTIDILTGIAEGLSIGVGELFGPSSSEIAPRRAALTAADMRHIDHVMRLLRRLKAQTPRRTRASGD